MAKCKWIGGERVNKKSIHSANSFQVNLTNCECWILITMAATNRQSLSSFSGSTFTVLSDKAKCFTCYINTATLAYVWIALVAILPSLFVIDSCLFEVLLLLHDMTKIFVRLAARLSQRVNRISSTVLQCVTDTNHLNLCNKHVI